MALIMIKGIGIDSIEIARFRLWHTYSYRQLSRIFSSGEIDYCLSNIIKSSERFAVRFAAREAFFKAFAPLQKKELFFLTVCAKISIFHTNQEAPHLLVNWPDLEHEPLTTHISLTHTKNIATAVVILEHYKQEEQSL